MSLKQDNFDEAAKLASIPCGQIQTVITSLWDNTNTRIKLKDAVVNGRRILFDLVEGDMSDVDEKCQYQGVKRTSNQLDCL